MNMLVTRPAQLTPTRRSQMERKLSAKAMRTSDLSGSSMVWISGMIEYTTDVSVGILNWVRNFKGMRLLSWFCKIAPPAVTPQICKGFV